MPSINSKLNFSQTLVGKEKTIPAGELLKRLKGLNEELRKVNQEEVDATCDRITLELITPTLIHHRDHGVRAVLACCLSEILRIYAPKAPYNSDHVQDIFSLFIKELRELTRIDDTYYLFRVQLLTSIATVRSCILIHDLDTADDLVMELFHVLLTHLNAKHPLVLHQHAVNILVTLVEYASSIPMELTEFMLTQFQKETPSFRHDMVVQVLQRCTDAFQKSFCQYFVELLLDAAKTTSHSKRLSDAFVTLKQAHGILTQVYRDVPEVLFNVIPHLEEEMVTEQSQFRSLAMETIGSMVTASHAFYQQFPSTWKSWLLRRNDKLTEVRLHWLSFVPLIYQTHGVLVAMDLTPCLEQKLFDVDDQVRYMACDCVAQLPLHLVKQCMTRSFLDTLCTRIKDKSLKVRLKAVETVSQLWKQFMQLVLPFNEGSKITSKDPSKLKPITTVAATLPLANTSNPWNMYSSVLEEEELLDWLALVGGLPSFLLSSAYLNANDMTAVLENILIDDVIHFKGIPVDQWTFQSVRLVWFLSCAHEDPRALQAMYSVLQRQHITLQELNLFFQLILEKPTLTSKEDIDVWTHRFKCLIYLMVSRLPDPQGKGMDMLMKLSELPTEPWLPLFQTLVNWSQHDFQSIRKAGKKLLEYVETHIPGSRQFIGVLARRASPAFICQEHMSSFISMLVPPSHLALKVPFSETVHWLLHSIAKLFPILLLPESSALFEYTKTYPEKGLSILSYLTIPTFPTSFLHHLTEWLVQPELTLFVSKLLVHSNPSMFKPSLQTLLSTFESNEDLPSLLVPTIFFAQLAKHQREVFLEIASKLLPTILNWFNPERFLFPSSSSSSSLSSVLFSSSQLKNSSVTWLDSNAWPIPSQLQLHGLKLLTYHAAISQDPETLLHLISHILKRTSPLLTSWPKYAGFLLKLKASKALLRLAEHGFDARIPTSHWLLLLNVVQDPVLELREGVFKYLKTGLVKKKLSVRYVAFLCYSVLPYSSPSSQQYPQQQQQQHQNQFKASLSSYFKSQELILELPRMLFVFAHQGTWQDWIRILQWVLPAMLTMTSVGVAYQLMNLIKTHRCLTSSIQASTHVYGLADLTLQLIQDQCKLHHWPLTYTTETALPSDLFVPLPLEEAKLNATKSYLPSSLLKKRGHTSHTIEKDVVMVASEPNSPVKKQKTLSEDVEMTSSSP